MRKLTHLFTAIVVFFVTLLTSCEKDSTSPNPADPADPVIEEKPSKIANVIFDNGNNNTTYYTDGVKTHYGYYFDTKNVIVNVEGYNAEYTYELQLVGEYLKNEYTTAVSLHVPAQNTDGGGKGQKKAAEELIEKTDDSTHEEVTALEVDVISLQLVPDKYTVILVEKETTKSFEVATPLGLPYFVLDTDAPEYLCTLGVENLDYTKINSLGLSDGAFYVRPTPSLKGVSVKLQICTTAGVVLQDLKWAGVKGSSGKNYLYEFTTTAITSITQTGEYLIRFHENKNDGDAANKVYKKSVFFPITIDVSSAIPVLGKD